MKGEKKANKTDIRKSQLMAAAFKVIGEKGYSNFTIRDIAQEADLSTGLIHYYFKNKEDLFLSLFKEMQKNIREELEKALSGSTDPLSRLRTFIDEAFRMIEREKDYFHLLIDFWSQIKYNERLKELSRKLFHSFRENISIILQDGIKTKTFPDMDVPHMSATILAILQGSILQYVIDDSVFDYRDFAGRQKERITKMVLGFR